jgi:hypothetical protein
MAAKISKAAREQELAELGYMSDEKLARILRVKPKTLYSRPDLPARHKLGRENVRRIDDVKAWMARRAVAA